MCPAQDERSKEGEEQLQCEEQEEEVQAVVRRNQNMQKLLAVLDGAARLGADRHGTQGQTPAPTSGQPQTHYRPGDLGLVPRQKQTSRSSKVGSHSTTTSQPPRSVFSHVRGQHLLNHKRRFSSEFT